MPKSDKGLYTLFFWPFNDLSLITPETTERFYVKSEMSAGKHVNY